MITLNEFLKRTDAEMVAGMLVVGAMTDRRVVGEVSAGSFSLNDDGQRILIALESGDPSPVKAKAVKRKPTDNAGKTRDDFLQDLEAADSLAVLDVD